MDEGIFIEVANSFLGKPPRRSKKTLLKAHTSAVKSPPTSDYDSDQPGYFSGASCDCDSSEFPDAPSINSPTGDLNSSLYGSKKKKKNPFDYARKLVSRHKKRYEADGYNLDLAYVTDNIIAMGFPSLNFEKMYRNPYPQVYKFLEEKHKDHYKVYNLCIEKTRQYNYSLFHNRVSSYPFSDHNAPSLQLIYDFCKDIDEWLKQDKENIAAVHCKAGKGRTGVMICCYLIYIHQFIDPIKCMHFYARRRTEDEQGVTIPSQRRFVVYWSEILRQWFQNKSILLRNEGIGSGLTGSGSVFTDGVSDYADEDNDDDDDDEDGKENNEFKSKSIKKKKKMKNRNSSVDLIFANNNNINNTYSVNSDNTKSTEYEGDGEDDEDNTDDDEDEDDEDIKGIVDYRNDREINDLIVSEPPPSLIPPVRSKKNMNKFKTYNGPTNVSKSVDSIIVNNNNKRSIPPLSPLKGFTDIANSNNNNNNIIEPSPILFNRYNWKVNYGQLPNNIPLTLTMVRVTTGSDEVLGFKCTYFTVESGNKKYSSESFCSCKVINRHFNTTDTPVEGIVVNGEAKVVFFYKTDFVCGFWFHSSFVTDNKLILRKDEIDGLCKDDKNKKCPKTTRFELYFNRKLPN